MQYYLISPFINLRICFMAIKMKYAVAQKRLRFDLESL